MLLSLFSDIFREYIGGRYPSVASDVKTERKDIFVTYFPHSSGQRCFYQTPGSRQPHITAVL